MKNSPLSISNITVQPGERITAALPTPELYTCAPMFIPIHIIHGKFQGPTLLVCGAMHGDEVNGVAILHKLLNLRLLKSIKGTLILIPNMNVYGLMSNTRNLPDRRDLEGSFPGSEKGSFASRLAHQLNKEIFSLATHCIDLHTGEPHISKFPHVKTNMERNEASELAKAFHAPVIVNTKKDSGLLWLLKSIPTIIYETGEAQRLDPKGIKFGIQGIIRSMRHLNMLPPPSKQSKNPSSSIVEEAIWKRAPSSGMCETFHKLGAYVKKGHRLATISDPFGTQQTEEVFAPTSGIIVGINNYPILNEGEPLLQIAEIHKSDAPEMDIWKEDGEALT
ncbi:MAG: succinylglutamate desuccinylase/aspartoacylase family protein [Simkaniaceae bacterium]|nr:succinylglutamate desuccinylase/aspartoacylase family protein [Simkaniaceae bacterium]